MPYLLFLKKRHNFNCRLLQIIGGALRVKRACAYGTYLSSYWFDYYIIKRIIWFHAL